MNRNVPDRGCKYNQKFLPGFALRVRSDDVSFRPSVFMGDHSATNPRPHSMTYPIVVAVVEIFQKYSCPWIRRGINRIQFLNSKYSSSFKTRRQELLRGRFYPRCSFLFPFRKHYQTLLSVGWENGFYRNLTPISPD